jgi:hypothetical protein
MQTQGQERLPLCAITNYSGHLQCPAQQSAVLFFGILASLLLGSSSGALEAFRLEGPSDVWTVQPGVKDTACHVSCCVALVGFNSLHKAFKWANFQ